MSIAAMQAVFEATAPLTAHQRLVLLVLADKADDAGRNCWPAQATIARRAGTSRRGVQKVLAQLEQRQLIRVAEPATGTRSVRYEIELGRLASGEPRSPLRGEPRSPIQPDSSEPCSPQATAVARVRGEPGDTIEANGETSSSERRAPDPSDPSMIRQDQPALPVRSHREGRDGAIPFKVHVAIASKAIDALARARTPLHASAVAEQFKQLAASQGLAYDAESTRKAVDAALVAHAKRRERFLQSIRPGLVPTQVGKYAGITQGDDDA